jgi:nucleoside-diphosphate-sugar epimerase
VPPNSQETRTALVIGATGGIGGAVAHALAARGFAVRALHRDPTRTGTAAAGAPVQWVKGDAMREADVMAAAAGTDLIFHGANPPGYVRWRELAIPMLRSSIAAAQASGARLMFPGNVYNFGSDAGALVDERAPQYPRTRKGAVRVEMERMLAEAAERGARALVIRAGDFLGNAAGSWFRAAMIKPGPGKPVRSVTYPGKREVGHAWAYLPDLAETFARLAEIEHALPDFDVFHFGGHWIEPGVEIAHAVRSEIRGCRSAAFRGRSSISRRCLCRSCASWSRCAISGRCRCASTTRSLWRGSARSPTLRSTRRCGRRSTRWAVCSIPHSA